MLTPSTSAALVPLGDGAVPIAPFRADYHHRLVGLWLGWLADQVDQGQLASGTIDTYQRGVRTWLAYLDEVARTDRPTPAVVGSFLAAVRPGRKPASANVTLNVVKAFYRWAEAHDHYPNVARSIRTIRVDRDGPMPALRHDQVAVLLALVVGEGLRAQRDRALVSMLYGTGCRTVSLARALIADLDVAAGTLRHRPKGHRDADSVAYLPPATSGALFAYLTERHRRHPLAPEQPLFITLDRRVFGHPLTTYSMRAVIRGLMERAGHARRGPDGRLVSPGVWSAHCLRRSALTTAADAHGLEAAQALAGHADIGTTRRFYVRSQLDGRMRSLAATLDLNQTHG